MTQNEVLAMLHDIVANHQEYTTWTVSTPHLVMLVNKVVEAEREACAELIPPQYFELRDAIRARGETK